MDSGVMIVLSVICCVIGFFLNRTYATKYGEAAVQWKLFVLQVIGIGGALTQLPVNEISLCFLFWITVTLLSYGAGLLLCRQHAKRQQAGPSDTVIAMAAQALLPVGAAVVILLTAGMIAFGFLWDH